MGDGGSGLGGGGWGDGGLGDGGSAGLEGYVRNRQVQQHAWAYGPGSWPTSFQGGGATATYQFAQYGAPSFMMNTQLQDTPSITHLWGGRRRVGQ